MALVQVPDMWCSACQQDVTANPAPDRDGELRCSKCAQALQAPSPAPSTASTGAAPASEPCGSTALRSIAVCEAVPSPSTAAVAENTALERNLLDQLGPDADWELEFQMAGVRQLVAWMEQYIAAEPLAPTPSEVAHTAADASRFATAAQRRPLGAQTAPERQPVAGTMGHWLSWSAVGIGAGLLACGSVLLLWSVLADRDDLWSVGLPLAALGQGGLFLGLISQLAASSTARIPVR